MTTLHDFGGVLGRRPSHIFFWALTISRSQPMIRENRKLVTNEPVEFEKQLVEVQDCKKITIHSRIMSRMYPNLIKKKPKDVNM